MPIDRSHPPRPPHQKHHVHHQRNPQRRAPRQKPTAPDDSVAGCMSRQSPTFHVARYILTHGYHHPRQGAVDRPALGDDGRYLSAISALSRPGSTSSPPHNRCLPPAGGDRPVVRHVPGNLFAVHAWHADERWKVVERPTELLPARAFAISLPPAADKTGWGWALRHFEGDCFAGRTGSRVKRWVWGRGRWEGIYRGVRELVLVDCVTRSLCVAAQALLHSTSPSISGSHGSLSNHTSSPS